MNELTRLASDESDDFRARFTTAEFEQMCESGLLDDWKIELIDGELERMQSPMNMHAMRQAHLVVALSQACGLARVRGAAGIDLGNDTVVECDAAVLREPVLAQRRLTPADLFLVVEIAETTLRRDLGMKRKKYGSVGIPHYWVVDGKNAIVNAFSGPVDDGYADEAVIAFGDPLPVPGTDETITVA